MPVEGVEGKSDPITVDSTTISIPQYMMTAVLDVPSAQNVDNFDTDWHERRRLTIFNSPGSAAAVTLRDNQAGTNLVMNGTSQAIGAGDSMKFQAFRDSSGNKMWYQVGTFVDIS